MSSMTYKDKKRNETMLSSLENTNSPQQKNNSNPSNKWVVNLSRKTSTEDQVQVLGLGLNFAIAPKEVPIGVRERILLGGRKKFALKITICPKNRQLVLKLTF